MPPTDETATKLDIEMPTDGIGSASWWNDQLQWSEDTRKEKVPKWKERVAAYLDERPIRTKNRDEIRVNIEYEKTEQKKPQLFFQVPEFILKAQLPGLERAVLIFQAVINYYMGPKGVDLKSVMREILFDVLCPAGIGIVQVGYQTFVDGTKPIQVGEEPDPEAQAPEQPGAVLGLSEGTTPMRPVFKPVPNIIAEKYYLDRISPAKALMPADFDQSNYDKAPWLGYDFWIDKVEAVRREWIRQDDMENVSSKDDDLRLVDLLTRGTSRSGQIKCRKIWYYAHRVDPKVVNPDLVRQLVFVDGKKAPVLHEDSRWQKFGPDGKLIGGLRGLPIKILALRYVSDLVYPPSDCAISSRQTDELGEGRTQMVKQRRRSVPLRAAVKDRIDADDLEKIKSGDIGEIIGVNEDPDKSIKEITRGQFPRENFGFNDIIHADIDRLWALGSNQSAVRDKTTRTATELTLIQRATDTRLVWEQGLVIDFVILLAEAIGSLIQLFADDEDYIEIAGEDGARELVAWDKTTIQGKFAYAIRPDSARRPDAAHQREVAVAQYNLLANDPTVNRLELVRQTLEAWGADPIKLIKPPAKPEPDPPRVSLALKGEDLDPSAPQYPNIVNLLIIAGIPVAMPPNPSQPSGNPETEQKPPRVIDRARLSPVAEEGMGGTMGGPIASTGSGGEGG